MPDVPDRGAPSNIKGWLSEVYLNALLSAQEEQLVRRLGERATIDDPLFGRAKGLPAIVHGLREMGAWLAARAATFEKTAFTMGSDRDVTEGLLSVNVDSGRVSIPLAVVAERRPGREVEMRLYYSTTAIQKKRTARSPLVPLNDELSVPPPVAEHIAALARGDADAAFACFENGGTLQDSSGQKFVKGEPGTLRAHYEASFSPRAGGDKRNTVTIHKGGRADDGRTCALEYVAMRAPNDERSGLAAYELGENGLLRAVRCYEDAG
ncbi:MAG: hypothetical protein M3O36_08780 [Myxococcota bacterium]|nr:hypothetical protein [Myxococcota bacterium]